VEVGFSLDPSLGLDREDELRLVRLGAELGYRSAWTPSGADEAAFDRCRRWHAASGLPTGILVVPASGRPAEVYARWALETHETTGHRFIFGVGSGHLDRAAEMRDYLASLHEALGAPSPPVYLGALGPFMLRLAGEAADGAALNWCTSEQVAASRAIVEDAARRAGRPVPLIAEYIRVCVSQDPDTARRGLSVAMLNYALGPPAYRQHFERMGFGDELRDVEPGPEAPERVLRAVGGYGRPGEVRDQFYRLAEGLDIAIVRVVVPEPGDSESARLALEEFAPG
jgi:alkanesulfonate monooxygenase SsuD/methylene tetrahydromethanopterin reductase-like flavin-dependent oxidoreductase (luciferase family)